MTLLDEVDSMLRIDGAMGEGGGQVVRSSLSLAALTGTPVCLENIRAGRRKPGLLRQHLTAVKAAAEVCSAKTEGVELGSRRVVFRPGRVAGGEHRFAVGTAGSATLVCQTVLPLLLNTSEPCELTFEGGTHNPMAPPFDFLEELYAPLLRGMGFSVQVELGRAGFYPAGGGRFAVTVSAPGELSPLELVHAPSEPELRGWVIQSRLPAHVAQRERVAVAEGLNLPEEAMVIRKVRSPGPGNAVSLAAYDGERCLELCTAFGERGRPAEKVAEDVVTQMRGYLADGVPVGEHLADQLLVPMVLAGGSFVTGPLSSHTRTNIEVLRLFLGPEAVAVEEESGRTRVSLPVSVR